LNAARTTTRRPARRRNDRPNARDYQRYCPGRCQTATQRRNRRVRVTIPPLRQGQRPRLRCRFCLRRFYGYGWMCRLPQTQISALPRTALKHRPSCFAMALAEWVGYSALSFSTSSSLHIVWPDRTSWPLSESHGSPAGPFRPGGDGRLGVCSSSSMAGAEFPALESPRSVL
jgi:hypothetical protein